MNLPKYVLPHRFFKLKGLPEICGGVVDPYLALGETLEETPGVGVHPDLARGIRAAGEHRLHGFESGLYFLQTQKRNVELGKTNLQLTRWIRQT